jgi:hypothetical protein
VIEAYFDDSGKQAASPYVCIAGYLADYSYWTPFVMQWRHLLWKHGISALHMNELMTGNGEFSSIEWKHKKDAVVSEFIEVIVANRLIGFGVAVESAYWNSLPRAFQKRNGNAQEFCFERILRRIRGRLTLADSRDYVSIIFDHDMEFSKPRLTKFDNVMKRDDWARERYSSITFANSRVHIPLQAADLLAWTTRRSLQDRASDVTAPHAFMKLVDHAEKGRLEFACGEYWDKEEFEKRVDVATGTIKEPPVS